MAKIGIVYYTKTDITGQLVQGCADAIIEAGGEVYTYLIEGNTIIEGRFADEIVFKELEECDGIILASPTYMGSVTAQFKTFVDASGDAWYGQKWAGKVAAGITCGGGLNGDQANTLQYMVTVASQHGMLWVPLDTHGGTHKNLNRLGCQLGVVANAESKGVVNDVDLQTAKYLGERVLKFAEKLAD